MGWSVGYDPDWNRDVGYGVPATCDYPGCDKKIHRGLAHVCGSEPWGGSRGCGLYFCADHLESYPRLGVSLCHRCGKRRAPYKPKSDHPEWVRHKLKHRSWAGWRKENLEEVKQMKDALKALSREGEDGRLETENTAD